MEILVGCLSEKINKRGKIQVGTLRKIFATLSLLPSSLLIGLLAFYGNNLHVSLIFITLHFCFISFSIAGPLSNILDVAPKYATFVLRVSCCLSSVSGFASTFVVGLVTEENQNFESWDTIFWVISGSYFSANLIFLIFGSGTEEKCNSLDGKSKKPDNYYEMYF